MFNLRHISEQLEICPTMALREGYIACNVILSRCREAFAVARDWHQETTPVRDIPNPIYRIRKGRTVGRLAVLYLDAFDPRNEQRCHQIERAIPLVDEGGRLPRLSGFCEFDGRYDYRDEPIYERCVSRWMLHLLELMKSPLTKFGLGDLVYAAKEVLGRAELLCQLPTAIEWYYRLTDDDRPRDGAALDAVSALRASSVFVAVESTCSLGDVCRQLNATMNRDYKELERAINYEYAAGLAKELYQRSGSFFTVVTSLVDPTFASVQQAPPTIGGDAVVDRDLIDIATGEANTSDEPSLLQSRPPIAIPGPNEPVDLNEQGRPLSLPENVPASSDEGSPYLGLAFHKENGRFRIERPGFQSVDFGRSEMPLRVVKALARHRGRRVSKDDLQVEVYGKTFSPSPSALRQLVRSARQLIPPLGIEISGDGGTEGWCLTGRNRTP